MAIYDRLYLTADLNEEESLKLFFQCLGSEAEISNRGQDGPNPYAQGDKPDRFVATAQKLQPTHYIPIKPAINPTIAIDFRLREWLIAEEEILNATIKLLEQTTWDVALVFGDSAVILVRKENKLILNKATGLWTPERIAGINLPFELQEIPNL